ncbi:MAG: hypothetical protein EBR82_67185 [Caulobacteraceae bacterium]|nr:hypothetical protein [Caulobacteraceae bacterium]
MDLLAEQVLLEQEVQVEVVQEVKETQVQDQEQQVQLIQVVEVEVEEVLLVVMEDRELLLFNNHHTNLLPESGQLMTHIITRKAERGQMLDQYQ